MAAGPIVVDDEAAGDRLAIPSSLADPPLPISFVTDFSGTGSVAYATRWLTAIGLSTAHLAAADQWAVARAFVEANHLPPGVRCHGKVESRPLPSGR
eukprot:10147034-Alexandrium_andersonii.AAC.1